jgi:predicted AAA+ superfamily ATPase
LAKLQKEIHIRSNAMQSTKPKLNKKELRMFIEGMLVPHDSFINASKYLEQGFDIAETIKDSIGLFILGESRTGKTRLLEDFRAIHPSYRTNDGLMVPVLYVEVPSKPTVKGLASKILAALGDPLADKGTEQQLERRLLKYLEQCKTQVLILDEIQNFVDKSAKFTVIFHMSDWLKSLLNQAKIVIVIAGLPYGDAVFGQNEQLRGRFKNSIKLPRFNWEDDDSRNQFLGLLDGFTALLRQQFDTVDLGSDEMAYRFYLASGGLTGYVFNIIRVAAWNVIADERTTITIEDIDSGYQQFVSDLDQLSISPFSKKFNFTDGNAFERASRVGRRAEDYGPEKSTHRYKPRKVREALA